MTGRLRKRHRVMVCALGVVLPILFAAGMAARKPIPSNPSIQQGSNALVELERSLTVAALLGESEHGR